MGAHRAQGPEFGRGMRRTVSVNVDVDVNLSDIGTDDLVEELERRQGKGSVPFQGLAVDHSDAHQLMFEALRVRDDARALDLLRNYLCDCLGRATV